MQGLRSARTPAGPLARDATRGRSGSWFERALDRAEPGAARLASRRYLGVELIAGAFLVSAACAAFGYFVLGPGNQHQLFRDLGPSSLVRSVLICTVALFSVLIARRETRGGDWRDIRSFWFICGPGFLYLAVDGPLDIHGKLGSLAQDLFNDGSDQVPFINRISDGIVGLYLVGGLTIAAWRWRDLVACRRALAWFAAGAVLVAVKVGLDSELARSSNEEMSEEMVSLFAAAVLVRAFAARYRWSSLTPPAGAGVRSRE